MVCVTITRDKDVVDGPIVEEVRDELLKAIVKVMKVKSEDIEVAVRDMSARDRNLGKLNIVIEGEEWQLERYRTTLLQLNAAIEKLVPEDLRKKGQSKISIRPLPRGKSMPIGCPNLMD